MRSLWGATLGAILISLLDSYLSQAENGLGLGLFTLNLPSGTSNLVLGVLMAAMLILRPRGVSGGRELTLRIPAVIRARLRSDDTAPPSEPEPSAGVEQGAAPLEHH
jgi:branched-chain amino acid transport system permease protein